MPDRILCYDFGGTGFRVGVADRNGMLAQERRDISKVSTNLELNEIAVEMGEKALNDSSTKLDDLMGAGIGGAGTWDGLVITFAPNSPIKHNISFPNFVKMHFRTDVIAGNDIRAAVHAVVMYGHGKGRNLELVCAITYSSGNNIGILNRGLPYPGYSDLSQEAGHAHIEHGFDARKCSCEAKGCFEAYVSATAAAGMARDMLKESRNRGDRLDKSHLYKVAKKALEEEARKELTEEEIISGIRAEHVYDALAKHKDSIALRICELQKFYIAQQLAHVCLHHRPQLIELFGGLTNQAELLFNPAIENLRKDPVKYAYPGFEPPEIKITELGDLIGLYGAAGMVLCAEKAGRLG